MPYHFLLRPVLLTSLWLPSLLQGLIAHHYQPLYVYLLLLYLLIILPPSHQNHRLLLIPECLRDLILLFLILGLARLNLLIATALVLTEIRVVLHHFHLPLLQGLLLLLVRYPQLLVINYFLYLEVGVVCVH